MINGQSWNGGGGAGFSNMHNSQINDSLTWIKGKHTMKFGFQYLKTASNNVSSSRSNGFFNFKNQETADPPQFGQRYRRRQLPAGLCG